MRARVEAKQAYLNTYNMAVKAENAAESQERKDRAARQKVCMCGRSPACSELAASESAELTIRHAHVAAQHELQRHKLYGALKGRADKKEGWIKLQREMVSVHVADAFSPTMLEAYPADVVRL